MKNVRPFLQLLVFYLLFISMGSAQTEETEGSDCRKADYDCRITELNKKIEQRPFVSELYRLRGYLYYGKGDYPNSKKDYLKAINLDDKNGKAYAGIGAIYSVWSSYDRAIIKYSQAIERDPKDVEFYQYRARVYVLKGDYQSAIRDYDKGIEIEPDKFELYGHRGALLERLGKVKESQDAYRLVIKKITEKIEAKPYDEQKAAFAEFYLIRGMNYVRITEREKAIADFNRGIQLDEDYDDLYFFRGIALFELKEFSKALGDFNKALELSSEYAEVYKYRAAVYRSLGDREKMLADLEKFNELTKKP